MESAPTQPTQDEEAPSTNEKDTKKSKKKAESLGAFLVEAKPRLPEQPKPDKRESRWAQLTAKPEKAEKEEPSNKENDKTPELQAEAPLEHLSEEERAEVNKELAGARRQEVSSELAGAEDTATTQETAAAEAYLERVAAHGDPEQAFSETLAEYGVEAPEMAQEIAAAEAALEAAEPESAEEVIDMTEPNEGEVPLQAAETGPDEEEEETPSVTPSATASGSGSAGSPPNGSASSGTGTPPPSGPGPNPPVGSMPPFGSGGSGGFTPAVPAANRPSRTPNMISAEDALYYERQAQNRGLLVGGIVGYLLGRRRGRIRTERRLLPVQHRLEREVKQLQSRLFAQEQTIRKVVAEHPRIVEVAAASGVSQERLASQRVAAPEARQLHGKKLPPERIGRVIVTAEARAAGRPERRAEKAAEKAEKVSPEKRAETMDRRELLEMSERIAVDGASLRQVYETHLVSERGLRRLITEYLRGGDVKRALKRELIEREIDFERDPILRDRARSSLSHAGTGKAALNSLLRQAGAAPLEENEALGQGEAEEEAAGEARARRQRRAADVAMMTLIVVLSLAVIILLSRR